MQLRFCYGHRLLNIDEATSEKYRSAVQQGHCGLKPGWCRVGLHWVMDDAEADYVIEAIHFLAREGHHFLGLYDFDLASGTWVHRYAKTSLPKFSLDAALVNEQVEPAMLTLPLRQQLYRHYLAEARKMAEQLKNEPQVKLATLGGELEDLQFFALPGDDRAKH